MYSQLMSRSGLRAVRRSNAEAVIDLSQRRVWHMPYSGEFTQLTDLDPVLEEIFFLQYRQIPNKLIGNVFGRRDSTKSKESNTRIGSFRDPQDFKGQIFYDEPNADYDITYAHAHKTLGFKVEKTLLEDMQYDGIFDQASKMGQSFARKRNKDAAGVFNNAFATVLGYDSKVLCATDHPRSQTDSTAVSNSMGTGALNDANLETALLQLEGLGDDRGEEVDVLPDLLLVGRQNRKKALELAGSPMTPESANNAINTHSGLTVIVDPRITSKKWFVIDGGFAQMVLKWFDRLGPEPEFGVDDDRATTLMRSYFGRVRYSFGWSDWRFVVGSNAS